MSLLFRSALLLLILSATVGYGAVFFALLLGPLVRRLDPVDAAAVTRAAYRLGARRAEAAIAATAPAGAAAVALSEGQIRWSQPWLWIAGSCWLVGLVLRSAVVQPARRTQQVVLGELAGGGSSDGPGRRALLGGSSRRMQLGLMVVFVLFMGSAAALVFQPAG